MKIAMHTINDVPIAELDSEEVMIHTPADMLDLLGNVYFQGSDRIILFRENITPAFFDLKNGIAGEMLQKCSNYRVRLAIVGDFSQITSQSVNDFIRESNRGRHVNFVRTRPEAIRALLDE